MSNWCHNKLTITGPPKSIKSIKQRMIMINPKCDDETSVEYAFFNFEGVAKIPKTRSIASYNQWLKNHWGSLSNACNTQMVSSLKHDDALICVRFDTMGSFPHLLIQKLIEHYPECEFAFYYYEVNLCSAGEIRSIQNGQSISRHC